MASFTTEIKDEISKIETNKLESIAEVLAYLHITSHIENKNLVLYIENASTARRIFLLIKRIYGITPNLVVRTLKRFKTKTIYILEINEKLNIIISDIDEINKQILTLSDEEKKGYLKGIFLACGSINDPAKSKYHLELLLDDYVNATLVNDILISLEFNSKVLKRDKGYMVYIKSSEEISDFIKMLSAINQLFYYEDIRIYRDHKNMVNRLNNCEQANVEKSLKTCNEQLDNIKYLEDNDLIDLLDDKSKTIINYRKKYPETTMNELASIITLETDINITKSGINHHFRKIKELVNRDKNKLM